MARRVFFSFHYENDVFRAGVVRNSWRMQPNRETAGFWDAAAWEQVKRRGDVAIKSWIDTQLQGTSVTAVLIGRDTASRPYVRYEIQKSWNKGNGLFGIYIHNIKDMRTKMPSMRGPDPFVPMGFTGIRTYDWVNDDGYTNLGRWVEAAAIQKRNTGY